MWTLKKHFEKNVGEMQNETVLVETQTPLKKELFCSYLGQLGDVFICHISIEKCLSGDPAEFDPTDLIGF